MTVSQRIPVATLGVPRIGRRRELKFALENYWSGKSRAADLLATAKTLRAASWREQHDRGVSKIPSNDFSLYDHVLDTVAMVGAVPARYAWTDGEVPLDIYFAMARGNQGQAADCGPAGDEPAANGQGLAAMEMTKWFDTNYHYIVPELRDDQSFALSSAKPVDHFLEAKALGIHTRPVLLGPVTFLKLAKSPEEGFNPIALLPRLLPVYEELLQRLKLAGADWVQIDEPALVLDLIPNERDALQFAYSRLSKAAPELKIMVATYFGSLGDNLETAISLPVAGLHVDLVRAPEQLEAVGRLAQKELVLSLGLIDGRNVWRANLPAIFDRIKPIVAGWPLERVEIAPSCSMLHVPIDLDLETALDADVRSWLAFAAQKTDELVVLARALAEGRDAVAAELEASAEAAAVRATSAKVHDPLVEGRVARIKVGMTRRKSAFAGRSKLQADVFGLPPFPTTTIGSFPQTAEIRKARAAHAKGQLSYVDYEAFLKKEIKAAVRWQEEIGLDVLVHGEFERNDMVQYFAEQLCGFAFTQHGWVQSYGSRFVRPPIIIGDVSRQNPMTLHWWRYAQSLTLKPVKGMLTGPVTILNWSFVRDDLPRSAVCRQVALAIRDEVSDLEKAGAKMIQIDEAALREGLPLRQADWEAYLDWAVECFRLASTAVEDATQIHTHMCYSEFGDIVDAIAAMDADVISIEASRSQMELLDTLRTFKYPNDIGPGVYDIHSPRVPEVGEISNLIMLARDRLLDDQLWVNPDCGLKTRRWEEVRSALVNMVAAARAIREKAQTA
ncbi:MAG: 5-methyltetrahydropteroyltriglutamate--homocysteine S-methyltransferase [Mesorhizobium sp.]|uniref:5-methyltetrahydropteroyltriglutamate-- homocysteine S-methyltransferase n=1 Tax=unclassified Mesorhizobium TaxID=325217 RepID=UPI000F759303|nr:MULTISPECIES: 5-methyltetrahydropteroyltriglutamate--homocysteine S-methyltransferase [unclassified Mesorhizobium]RVC81698.1 5-methyltetrahydropteroyltriglutamate--homocysteine S-methyltransferase [Mesorhizobium sp. M2A.F.Ca.ET.046.02.1.1]AZO34132.1 5-methyltetrahydropteroyltriglutamate--homocysteine S-methyltransferase [Mesorhizobium sp. M2A.F.Ca.ET.046.03.2.1]AZO75821.1 5-methyltetrahydropteroyltriglutamate--homocysteine S-methyltransferase [Mesorhizobium sp. M1D.F.Ca.ET.043.01.1.1]RWB3936